MAWEFWLCSAPPPLAHAYFVDLARLGEGAAQGGAKGFIQDIFRVMNFIPQGKVLGSAKAEYGAWELWPLLYDLNR